MAWTNPANASTSTGTRSNSSVSKPSGTAAGDVIVIQLYIEDNSPGITVTEPSGFTPLNGGFNTGTSPLDMRHVSCYRIADGSEGSSFAFTHSSAFTAVACSRFAPTTVTPALDVQGTVDSDSGANSTSTLTVGAITTLTADCLVVLTVNNFNERDTSATGYTQAVEVTGGNGGCCYIGWKEQASAGSTGDAAVSFSGNTGPIGLLAAFKNGAGGGGGVTVRTLAALGVG